MPYAQLVMDKMNAAKSNIASLSGEHKYVHVGEGYTASEVATPKSKVGLEGKGERVGAMPLQLPA